MTSCWRSGGGHECSIPRLVENPREKKCKKLIIKDLFFQVDYEVKGDSGLGQAPIPRLARTARNNKVRFEMVPISGKY